MQALNVKQDKIESKGIKSIRSRVANITEFLKEPISIIQLRERIIKSIFKDFSKIPIMRLSEQQWGEVLTLAKEKYRSWDWNFGRSPEFNVQKTNRFSFGLVDARLHVKNGIIMEMKFYGDFLGHGDTEEIEKKLIGKRYNEEEVTAVLKLYDLKFYFGDVMTEDFVKYLVN